MKIAAFITTAIALAGSAIAVPAQLHPKLQASIQELRTQINYVINDIVQSNPVKLKPDYATGLREYIALVNKLQGTLPCGPIGNGWNPTTANEAIGLLQQSQLTLADLAQALQDPSNSIPAGDLHPFICVPLDYYLGVTKFVTTFRRSS